MAYNEYEIVDGKKLAYVRVGEWTENTILFFHGFTGSKEYFPIEDGNVCIVSFDRPGVGESDVVEYYSMEYFLKAVYRILKQHSIVSVNLIGHSAGGYYAQVFASMYPDFVKSISLLNSMVPLNSSKTKGVVN